MRLIVCGSRDFADRELIWNTLNGIWASITEGYMVVSMRGLVLIEGGCPDGGADRHAEEWAITMKSLNNPPEYPEKRYAYDQYPEHPPFEHHHMPADWSKGKAAGPRRNRQMLTRLKEHSAHDDLLVLAFVNKDLSDSVGTANMVDISLAAGVRCTVVRTYEPLVVLTPQLGSA